VGRIVPVAYFDDRGKAVGFAIDVINEAARREDISVAWTTLVKGVAEDLQSGTIDLLSAGMATEERKKKFYVSEPWWYQELALLTRAGAKQPLMRLGLQHVYVEFARPHFDPATFIVDPPDTNAAAAIEAKAVCKGTLDGALITHGELHDLFLNRPEECTGVRLESVDTAIKYGLSIIARKSDDATAKRLRKHIDSLILDGTLIRFAAAHPPLPISGAVHLQENIRHRFQRRIWMTAGIVVVVLLVFLGWFLWDRHRDLLRLRRSEARILELNRALDGHVTRLQILLREKTLLLQEVQHRVKNNLQVISSLAFLQAAQAPDRDARQSLLAMRDRVKSMALIHETCVFRMS
jgi:two-component sensor histidine kinase